MLIAVLGTALIAGAITAMGETAMYADTMLITGLGAAGLLIVLGAITLYVPGAWWAIGIMAASLTAAALGGGLVAVTAVLGFVGGLLAMMQAVGRTKAA